MKTTIRSLFLLLILTSSFVSFAQSPADDPKYGDTPEERQLILEKISLYSEYVKQKNYVDALPHWRYVFLNRPKAFKGIYTSGEKIMVGFIKKNKKDKAVSSAYLDTLIMVFDQRIEHFGEKGKNEGRKGIAILKYKSSDYAKAYVSLAKSVQLEGVKTSAATASYFMQTSVIMLKKKKHDANQVVEDFGLAMDILEPAIETKRVLVAKTTDPKTKAKEAKRLKSLKTALRNVEKLFINSGAAGCDQLIGFFTPKFEATPDDIKLLKKITKYLDDQGCDDSELFAKAAEQHYKLEPSASAAYSIAKRYMKANELGKAIEYYNKAIELEGQEETPNEEKIAKYSYQKAVALFIQKKFSASRSAAQFSIKHNGAWGKPYILIARLYAQSSASCKTKLDANAIFWAAVDKLHRAKSVDPECAADAKKLIGQYSKHFPNKEDAFFHGISAGNSYTIGCWINETTKARF